MKPKAQKNLMLMSAYIRLVTLELPKETETDTTMISDLKGKGQMRVDYDETSQISNVATAGSSSHSENRWLDLDEDIKQ